jgi:subtilisin family serine protease
LKTNAHLISGAAVLLLLGTVLAGTATAQATPTTYLVGFHGAPPAGSHFLGQPVRLVDPALRLAVVETLQPATFLALARSDPSVRYVEFNDPQYAKVAYTPNDLLYGHPGSYGPKIIGAEQAWDRTRGSANVKLAIIDSGIRATHEEFTGRVLPGYDFVNLDGTPEDDCGHGTHVTGIAAASINNFRGVAGVSQATILPVKGLGNSLLGCSGSVLGLAQALRYSADEGAHIISNSWGGSVPSPTLNEAIAYAHGKGATIVAAAGNQGPCDNCVLQPWRDNSDRVIVVGCTDSQDKLCSFSSAGPQVDLVAPGFSILSAWHTVDLAYQSASGTSMSTPFVAGAAALMKSLDPSLSAGAIENRLKHTAKDLGDAGRDNRFGYGRLDADRATAATTTLPIPPDAPTLTAKPGDRQAELSWTTPPQGGAPIQGYFLFRSTNGGPWQHIATFGIQNSHTDTGLVNGWTYHYTISAYNSQGMGAFSNFAWTVPAVQQQAVYSERFDNGFANGWTKSGDLWHVENGCVADHSAPFKLAWSRGGACDYMTGQRVAGWYRAPAVDLTGKTQATLSFVHIVDVEQSSSRHTDILRVEVSRDGHTWTTLQQWDSQKPLVPSWTEQRYNLDAYTGGKVHVRFWADSVDAARNQHKGWYIDDVAVLAL